MYASYILLSVLITGDPSSQCYPFFHFYANVQLNVTCGIHHHTTTEPDHAKRDSGPAVLGGAVPQQSESTKVCTGTQRPRPKSQSLLYFVNKIEEEMLKLHVSPPATRLRPQRLHNDTSTSRLLRSQIQKQPRHKS